MLNSSDYAKNYASTIGKSLNTGPVVYQLSCKAFRGESFYRGYIRPCKE